MEFVFINIFTLATALILLFILVIIPASTKKRNFYIVLLLVALIIHLIAELLYLLGVFNLIGFSIFTISMVTVLGPTLFFYSKSFYGQSTHYFVWHIIPYQIGLCLIWILILTKTYLIPQWFFSSYYGSIIAFYFLATVFLMIKNPNKEQDSWMKTIGVGFGVLVILHLSEIILINTNEDVVGFVVVYATSIQNIFIFIFLLIVIRQVFINPNLFSNANLRIPYKNGDSYIDKSQLGFILDFVETKKGYENPELTRKVVSSASGLSINQISEIINSTYKKNFNEWINDYRVNESKILLKESKMTIKEIYYKVGFNSKSAFNRAFKNNTGMTPSEFRIRANNKT